MWRRVMATNSSLPEDLYGLRLSTSDEAAALYNEALGRILRLESDPHHPLQAAVELDPDFAMGHLALGVVSHEFGIDTQTSQLLDRAARLAQRATSRERQFIDAYGHRVAGDYDSLLSYLRTHPRDVLGVSIAMPTIAFSGAYGLADQAWAALEEMAAHFPDDWWYIGLLAFARQDQGRMAEARDLAEQSLALESRGGNAAHAAAHVFLETGQHEEGLEWIDRWINDAGQDSTHRCHFSWHAALYELSLDDTDAVARRYHRQLATPKVVGTRALIDAASLLFRCEVEGVSIADANPQAVLDSARLDLANPTTPFVMFHAALGLALIDDEQGLTVLRERCAAGDSELWSVTLVGFLEALIAYVRGEFDTAADAMLAIRRRLVPIGGSYAQRSIVMDTAIASLCRAGRGDEAASLIESRLERRARPRDFVLLEHANRHRPS